MDPPGNFLASSPWLSIEGLILPRNADGSLCQPAPPPIRIQILRDADSHDPPQEPQQFDAEQSFHTFTTHTSENLEQERLLEELGKAQEAYNALLASKDVLQQNMKKVKDESEKTRRECERVAAELQDVMGQVSGHQETLEIHKRSVANLDELQRELAALKEANKELEIQAAQIEQRNSEISQLKSPVVKASALHGKGKLRRLFYKLL